MVFFPGVTGCLGAPAPLHGAWPQNGKTLSDARSPSRPGLFPRKQRYIQEAPDSSRRCHSSKNGESRPEGGGRSRLSSVQRVPVVPARSAGPGGACARGAGVLPGFTVIAGRPAERKCRRFSDYLKPRLPPGGRTGARRSLPGIPDRRAPCSVAMPDPARRSYSSVAVCSSRARRLAWGDSPTPGSSARRGSLRRPSAEGPTRQRIATSSRVRLSAAPTPSLTETPCSSTPSPARGRTSA